MSFVGQSIAPSKIPSNGARRHKLTAAEPASSFVGQMVPYTAHWTYDTYANAHTVGSTIVKNCGDTWFFLTADYDTSEVVKAARGKLLAEVPQV